MTSDNSHPQKGLIFNIQKFSIQDGPGIRTTIFMKGCPLKCPWCSNPEGISEEPQIMIGERKCISCKQCAEICSTGAISFINDTRTINWNQCNNCLQCGNVCPSHAIQVIGKHQTVDEVFKTAAQDEDFYITSGGGVTVSGGEALLQWDFVRDLFAKCKDAGFHTALDTTGYCPWENMEQVLEYTDLILFDIKHMDPAMHEAKTGVSNELILENLHRASNKTEIWLRIPLIPGFNDSEWNMQETARIALKNSIKKVSLLPYQEWGKDKYTGLGKQYDHNSPQGMLEHDNDIVSRCRKILESYGLEVNVGK